MLPMAVPVQGQRCGRNSGYWNHQHNSQNERPSDVHEAGYNRHENEAGDGSYDEGFLNCIRRRKAAAPKIANDPTGRGQFDRQQHGYKPW